MAQRTETTDSPASACSGELAGLLERMREELGFRQRLYEKMGYTTREHQRQNRGYEEAVEDVERWLQEDG